MNPKLHFCDSHGTEGYVGVSGGRFTSDYTGESDAIKRLLKDAKDLKVEEKNGTEVTPVDNGSEVPEEFVTNVVLTWEDREATSHEKFTHILQRIDTLSDIKTSRVITDSD